MTTTPAPSRHPLDGPFMTAVHLADYSDYPGYAIPSERAETTAPSRARLLREEAIGR